MQGNQDHGLDPDHELGDAPGPEPGEEAADRAGRTRDSSRSAEQRLLTSRALHEADLTVPEVWLRYFSFSGMVEEYEVHAYLQGLIDLPRLQRDLIAQAVNELIDELPAPRRAPADVDLDTDSGSTTE